jgi:large subunit ribosomal protein L16
MSILMPKKVKHRKWRKGIQRGKATRGTEVSFGTFGLMAMEMEKVTGRQLEAGRRTILRYLKKGGKLWVRIFPDRPITQKGTEVPMGGGKGNVDHYAFVTQPGRIIFELDGLKEDQAREAFARASDKLPIKTKFILRNR